MGRVRTYHTLERREAGGATTVLDYVESEDRRGWYAHEFDGEGRYAAVRRAGHDEVLAALADEVPDWRESRRI